MHQNRAEPKKQVSGSRRHAGSSHEGLHGWHGTDQNILAGTGGGGRGDLPSRKVCACLEVGRQNIGYKHDKSRPMSQKRHKHATHSNGCVLRGLHDNLKPID